MLISADDNDRSLRDPTSGEGFLYRYRDLADERRAWVKQIVVDSQMYFASPAHFNDPLDCRIRFRTEGPFKGLLENIDALARERGMPRGERRRRVREVSKNPAAFVRKVIAGFQKEVDATGVLSLSSSHESMLLWAHYAQGHAGVCLQLKVEVEAPFFAPAQPVEYVRELPVPSLLGDDRNERAQQLLLTKIEDWKYEREWRIVEGDKGPGPRSFPAQLLSAVILGSRISEGDRLAVRGWVLERGFSVPIYQAELLDSGLGLAFKAIA